MGCDIHMLVEQKHKGEWITINTLNGHQSAYKNDYSIPIVEARNYSAFAQLAGVRGPGPDAKGMPADASQTAKFKALEFGSDGHSHSYMGVREAADIFNSFRSEPVEEPIDYFFGIYTDIVTTVEDYRIVFWFDN